MSRLQLIRQAALHAQRERERERTEKTAAKNKKQQPPRMAGSAPLSLAALVGPQRLVLAPMGDLSTLPFRLLW